MEGPEKGQAHIRRGSVEWSRGQQAVMDIFVDRVGHAQWLVVHKKEHIPLEIEFEDLFELSPFSEAEVCAEVIEDFL